MTVAAGATTAVCAQVEVREPEHLRNSLKIQLQGEVAEVARLNPDLIDRTICEADLRMMHVSKTPVLFVEPLVGVRLSDAQEKAL